MDSETFRKIGEVVEAAHCRPEFEAEMRDQGMERQLCLKEVSRTRQLADADWSHERHHGKVDHIRPLLA